MGLISKITIGLVLTVVVHKLVAIIYMMDYMKHVYFHAPGPCRLVSGVDEGSEDLQTLSNGVALITSGLRFMGENENNRNRKGRIFMFDFNNPGDGAIEVSITGKLNMKTFHPHGLSLWEDKKTGEVVVFVISHPVDRIEDVIERFTYDQERNVLKHVKSITNPAFRVLNDIVATGSQTFYATNYYESRKGYMKTLEKYLKFPSGSVVYYDGNKASTVATKLHGPNGISISPDKSTVYIASTWNEEVLFYERHSNNSLTLKKLLRVHTRPDNINIESNGDLWIGAHPVYYRLQEHHADPVNVVAPSQVLRIKADTSFIEEVYSEDGVYIYGSSVADRYKDAILIGTVSHKLLYCQIKHLEK